MVHSCLLSGETEAGQRQGLPGCRKAESELTGAFGKLPHSSPFCCRFSQKQRLCNCVVCLCQMPPRSWFLTQRGSFTPRCECFRDVLWN